MAKRKYSVTLQLLPGVLEFDPNLRRQVFLTLNFLYLKLPQIDLGRYNTGLFGRSGLVLPPSKDVQSISPKVTDWRIPRPVLYTGSSRTESSSTTYASNYERNIRAIYGLEAAGGDLAKEGKLDHVPIQIPNEAKWFSSGSSSSSSSRTASSGSLLISPSNLNSLKHDSIKVKPADAQSIASSTHFTLVNGVTVPRKHISSCCNKSRQLTVLVITMTIILFCGILGAILFVELRAMELRHP